MIYTTLAAYADIFNGQADQNATLEDVFNSLLDLKRRGLLTFDYEIIRSNRQILSNAKISELKFFVNEYLQRSMGSKYVNEMVVDDMVRRVLLYDEGIMPLESQFDIFSSSSSSSSFSSSSSSNGSSCSSSSSSSSNGNLNGKAYVFGGVATDAALRNTNEYDPDTWTSKTDMPSPARDGLSASTIGNKGYIYGGEGTGYETFNDVDEYTPDIWVSKTNMPSPTRAGLAANTISNKGYIYGGEETGYEAFNDVDEYTSGTNSWGSKTDMPSPGRLGLAANTIGNKGYIYGGYDGDDFLRDTDEYTPDVWANKTDMPSPAKYVLAANTINNKGYTYGGFNEENVFKTTDEYTPDTWVNYPRLKCVGFRLH